MTARSESTALGRSESAADRNHSAFDDDPSGWPAGGPLHTAAAADPVRRRAWMTPTGSLSERLAAAAAAASRRDHKALARDPRITVTRRRSR